MRLRVAARDPECPPRASARPERPRAPRRTRRDSGQPLPSTRERSGRGRGRRNRRSTRAPAGTPARVDDVVSAGRRARGEQRHTAARRVNFTALPISYRRSSAASPGRFEVRRFGGDRPANPSLRGKLVAAPLAETVFRNPADLEVPRLQCALYRSGPRSGLELDAVFLHDFHPLRCGARSGRHLVCSRSAPSRARSAVPSFHGTMSQEAVLSLELARREKPVEALSERLQVVGPAHRDRPRKRRSQLSMRIELGDRPTTCA